MVHAMASAAIEKRMVCRTKFAKNARACEAKLNYPNAPAIAGLTAC